MGVGYLKWKVHVPWESKGFTLPSKNILGKALPKVLDTEKGEWE